MALFKSWSHAFSTTPIKTFILNSFIHLSAVYCYCAPDTVMSIRDTAESGQTLSWLYGAHSTTAFNYHCKKCCKRDRQGFQFSTQGPWVSLFGTNNSLVRVWLPGWRAQTEIWRPPQKTEGPTWTQAPRCLQQGARHFSQSACILQTRSHTHGIGIPNQCHAAPTDPVRPNQVPAQNNELW